MSATPPVPPPARSRLRFRFALGLLLALAFVPVRAARADAPDDGPAPAGGSRPVAAPIDPSRVEHALVSRAAQRFGAASTQVSDFDAIGGDDVMLTTGADLATGGDMSLDVDDSTGDLYAAVAVDIDPGAPIDSEIRVFRSVDGGLHWSSYGTLGSATPGVSYRSVSLHVGEGAVDNVYVAYAYSAPAVNATIRVAWKPLASPASVWTEVTALASAAIAFNSPSLHSSERSESGYRLFLAATGGDGNGDDIWVTRSTTFGASWDAGYTIATLSSGDRRYGVPQIRYGRGGVVHCTYEFLPDASTGLDRAVRYRRALNFMAASTDWQPVVAVTANNDGEDQGAADVAASPLTGDVILTHYRVDATLGIIGATARQSTDDGATWPVAAASPLPSSLPSCLDSDALGNFRLLCHGESFGDYALSTAPAATPRAFGAVAVAADRNYTQNTLTIYVDDVLVTDPTRGHQAGFLWTRASLSGPDTVFFDAEWLREPGRPNYAPGFPIPLPIAAASPPAIAEVDGDPQREIVFSDDGGNVVVRNHDGTLAAGWPVDIGNVAWRGPVAVGDIDGDGRNEVVAGNTTGQVYAFHGDGTLLPGFPHAMGVSGSTYVSLGRFEDPARLQIVAATGTRIRRIGHDGAQVGAGMNTVSSVAGPAAIGDVDHDGDREIVILQDGFMDVFRTDGSVQAFRSLPGKTFGAPPALADLDLDGDLEILAASEQGDLYAFRPDGSDMPGWPNTASAGEILNSPIAANFRGTSEPEVFWTERGALTPRLQAVTSLNGAMSGFPVTHTDGWLTYASPIVDVLVGSPDVFLAGRDSRAWSWSNFGTTNTGWPKDLDMQVEMTPATGDVDEDGLLDMVVLGATMAVIETNSPQQRLAPRNVWSMYGYNPERQFCLACDAVDQVTGVPAAGAPARLSLRVDGNPGRRFRFAFALPMAGPAQLDVYDVTGRRVASLFKSERDAGEQRVEWAARDERGEPVAAGVYYARLTGVVDGARADVVRKLTLLP